MCVYLDLIILKSNESFVDFLAMSITRDPFCVMA